MNNLIVIGLAGRARSGKDTVAQHLVHRHGFFRIGLADGVRAAFRDLDGPTWERTKELDPEIGFSLRWALQTLGTECRTKVVGARCHWVHHALIKIAYMAIHHQEPRHRFVIPDIRFRFEERELDMRLPTMDGIFRCWMIERDGAGLAGELGNHSSETEIEKIPVSLGIGNHGTIAELRELVDRAVEKVLKPLDPWRD